MPITAFSDISTLGPHFDPTKNITSDGDDVSIWGDDTADNRDVSQATTSMQPHTGLRTINGRNAILNIRADDHNMTSAAYSPLVSQPITIFAIIKADTISVGNNNYIIDSLDTTDRISLLSNTSEVWELNAGTALTGSAADTNTHFIVAVVNGASSKIYVDGVLDASGNAGTNKIGGMTLMSYVNPIYSNWDGIVGNIGFYEKAVTGAELTDLNDFGQKLAGRIVPAAPTSPVATPGDAENVITFTGVIGTTSYSLWHNTSSPAESGTKIDGITSGYTHTGLVNGTTYYYKVVANNDAGAGPLSVEVSATPAAAGSPPDAPLNLAIVSGTAENTATWDASAGADSYDLYRDTVSPVVIGVATKIATVTSPKVDTGLANNTLYYYAVTATNAFGESALSIEDSGKPIAAPTSLAAVPGNASGKNDITWVASLGANSYKLYWSLTSPVTTTDTEIELGDVVAYTHIGLTDDVEVFYKVLAVNTTGQSDLSNEDSSTPFGIPDAPLNVVCTPGDTQNSISFDNSVSATAYNIYHKGTSPVTTLDTKIPGVTSPHPHTGLPNETIVYYIVTAENIRGESVASLEVSGTPTAPPALPTDDDNNIETILGSNYLLGGV